MLEVVLSILKETREYQEWGWNALTLGALGTIVFTIVEAWGFWKQNQKIWRQKSGESISITLFSYMFFAFWAFIFYGIFTRSASSVVNGLVLGSFYIPIILGLFKFEGFTNREKAQFCIFALMVPATALSPWVNEVFLTISIGLIIATATMPWKLYKAGKTGALEIRLLGAYLTSTAFWVVYAFALNEWVLEILATIQILLFGVTTILWFWYYSKEKRVSIS